MIKKIKAPRSRWRNFHLSALIAILIMIVIWLLNGIETDQTFPGASWSDMHPSAGPLIDQSKTHQLAGEADWPPPPPPSFGTHEPTEFQFGNVQIVTGLPTDWVSHQGKENSATLLAPTGNIACHVSVMPKEQYNMYISERDGNEADFLVELGTVGLPSSAKLAVNIIKHEKDDPRHFLAYSLELTTPNATINSYRYFSTYQSDKWASLIGCAPTTQRPLNDTLFFEGALSSHSLVDLSVAK